MFSQDFKQMESVYRGPGLVHKFLALRSGNRS